MSRAQKREIQPACRFAAAMLLLSAAALPACRALPPVRTHPVPELQLQQDDRRMVLNAYGPPRIQTVYHLWYVGPEPDSLTHGADGWMTLLTFDEEGKLICQEFLSRGPEQGYLRMRYWINGQLGGRDRDNDLDRRMIRRGVELSQTNPSYRVTLHEGELFVLARVLPSENEAVVRWEYIPSGEQGLRDKVRLEADALPGRDEPLMERIDGVIGQRMLLIEAMLDHELNPPPPKWGPP